MCSYLADQQIPVDDDDDDVEDDDLVLWKDGNRSHPQYGCQLVKAEVRAEDRLRVQVLLRSGWFLVL